MKKTRIIVITTVLFIISASTAYAAGITVPLNSTLDVNTGTLDVPGDITFAGTFTADTGSTVVFKGTTQSDITGTNSFYDLTIDTYADGAKTVRFGEDEIQENNGVRS